MPLCSPLPETPLSSPHHKKICTDSQMEEVSNADILKAINELSVRFTSLELKINQNAADIVTIKENVEGIDHQMKITDEEVCAVNRRVCEQDEKIEEAERYSRRWNLKLFNIPETVNETAEDVRRQVFEIFGTLAPEERNKLGFLIDTVHRIGRPREDRSSRPVIVQFTMRTFRQKIWRASVNATVMKEKKLRLAEDLTRWERECRQKLWPIVEKARKEGKKTSWRGADVIIDGRRVSADKTTS